MANVDESKKRKNQVEEYDVAIDDDDVTQPEAAMSDTSASTSSAGLNRIMEQLIAMQQEAAKTKTEETSWRETTKTEETNWRLVQNENHTRTSVEIATLSQSIKGIDEKVGSLQADVLSLKGRVCAIEAGGPASKGEGKALTPRGNGDPWAAPGADPWQRYKHGEQVTREAPSTNLTPSVPNSHALEQRVGNRSTIILGGFPRDSCRADIEQALREYVHGHEGVLRVGSLGKYGSAGRINFTNNTTMWDFTKAN